jgi:hypothetical protein
MDSLIKVTIDDVEREVPSGLRVADVLSLLGLEIPRFFYFGHGEKVVDEIFFVETDGIATDAIHSDIRENMEIKTRSDKINSEIKAAFEVLLNGIHIGFICPTGKKEEMQILLKNCNLDTDTFPIFEEDGWVYIYIPGKDITGLRETDPYYFICYGIRPEEVFSQKKLARISEIIQDTSADVYLMIDRRGSEQLSELLGIPKTRVCDQGLATSIKHLGFKGINDIRRGLKIKALEEADELIKRLSQNADGRKAILPLISVPAYGLYRHFRTHFEQFQQYLSIVKSSFDLESVILKMENDHKCVTVGVCGDLEEGTLMEEEMTDTDFLMSPKEFATLARGHLDLSSVIEQPVNQTVEDEQGIPVYSAFDAFCELLTSTMSKDLTRFHLSENTEEIVLEIKGRRFSAVIGHGKESISEVAVMLEKDPSRFDLIEICEDTVLWNHTGFSLVKDREVNELYQKYLKAPGSDEVKRTLE